MKNIGNQTEPLFRRDLPGIGSPQLHLLRRDRLHHEGKPLLLWHNRHRDTSFFRRRDPERTSPHSTNPLKTLDRHTPQIFRHTGIRRSATHIPATSEPDQTTWHSTDPIRPVDNGPITSNSRCMCHRRETIDMHQLYHRRKRILCHQSPCPLRPQSREPTPERHVKALTPRRTSHQLTGHRRPACGHPERQYKPFESHFHRTTGHT